MTTFYSRRYFLRQSAHALILAPFLTPRLKASPNGRLRHAAIGASGMSWVDINAMSAHPQWELVAVSDVDSRNFSKIKAKFGASVRTYTDWRELLEAEDGRIDSVNVSIPDHMHGSVCMAALSNRLHVYGQKPLTQCLHECRAVTLKARAAGVVTQMGIQASSDFTDRYAVEMVQNGLIGKVREVHTFSNKAWGDTTPLPDRSDPVPNGFDWDKWLGVADYRPFLQGYYHPGEWRKRRDFGTGTLGDMGCHIFSPWFRALDLTAPITVKSTGPAPVDKHNWPINDQIEYVFPGTKYTHESSIHVTWYDGTVAPPPEIIALIGNAKMPGQGAIYVGTEGVLLHPHGGTPRLHPEEKFAGYKYSKLEPRDHWKDFIDCCLTGSSAKRPSANFDYAGPLTESVLLGCVASLVPNKELEWNTRELRFSNSRTANRFIRRSYRKGWELQS